MSYQQHIQNAKDLIYGSSVIEAVRPIFSQVKESAKEVQLDPALSGIGIAQKQDEIRREGAIEVAKIIRAAKKEVDKELDAAEKNARAAINQPNAKPADDVIRDFNDKYGTLKTELLVFNDRTAATKMLDLMRSTNDPYLAQMILDDFTAIGPAVNRSITNGLTVRTAYEGVKKRAETDRRAQAREALELVGNLRKTPPVNSMMLLGVTATLGSQYQNIINDYESLINE